MLTEIVKDLDRCIDKTLKVQKFIKKIQPQINKDGLMTFLSRMNKFKRIDFSQANISINVTSINSMNNTATIEMIINDLFKSEPMNIQLKISKDSIIMGSELKTTIIIKDDIGFPIVCEYAHLSSILSYYLYGKKGEIFISDGNVNLHFEFKEDTFIEAKEDQLVFTTKGPYYK